MTSSCLSHTLSPVVTQAAAKSRELEKRKKEPQLPPAATQQVWINFERTESSQDEYELIVTENARCLTIGLHQFVQAHLPHPSLPPSHSLLTPSNLC